MRSRATWASSTTNTRRGWALSIRRDYGRRRGASLDAHQTGVRIRIFLVFPELPIDVHYETQEFRMRTYLEMFVAFALLAAADAAAPQQAPTPAPAAAQPATQPPQSPEKPALKLRLDDLDRPSAITFGSKDGKKQDA